MVTDRGIFRTPDGGQHWLPTGFKDETGLDPRPPSRRAARGPGARRSRTVTAPTPSPRPTGSATTSSSSTSGTARPRPRPGLAGCATGTWASAGTGSWSTGGRRTAPRMRLINADGGEAEISGNGVRCLAAFAVRHGMGRPAARGAHRRRAAGGRGPDPVPRAAFASPPTWARRSWKAARSRSPWPRPRRRSWTIRWRPRAGAWW